MLTSHVTLFINTKLHQVQRNLREIWFGSPLIKLPISYYEEQTSSYYPSNRT